MTDGGSAIERIRAATLGTPYEGGIYLVGGVVRDQELGLAAGEDVDIVLEGSASGLAAFLDGAGLSEHAPVVFERFGTAMLRVAGQQVEIVSARAESYESTSRKPRVELATLRDDAYRRDFTINTLMANLHTGERLDLTGLGVSDLREGVIRTPLDPVVTFHDDPLRMLRAVRFAVRFGFRAVRFAVRFGFRIEAATWWAIVREAGRLNLLGPGAPVVSAERIRDELAKTLMTRDPARGLELLREAGLLGQFAPELLAMVGVTQNAWHLYDVWDHTMVAVRQLGDDASLEVRLGLLLHDVGKPATRSEDDRGVHFYEHQFVGAKLAARILERLRFPSDQVDRVCALVRLHMRLGEAQPDWSEAAYRRLVRDTGAYLDELGRIAEADHAAMSPTAGVADLVAVRSRIDDILRRADIVRIGSPLNGQQIMAELGLGPGPEVGAAKQFLTDEAVEGRLAEDDSESARRALREWWRRRRAAQGGYDAEA